MSLLCRVLTAEPEDPASGLSNTLPFNKAPSMPPVFLLPTLNQLPMDSISSSSSAGFPTSPAWLPTSPPEVFPGHQMDVILSSAPFLVCSVVSFVRISYACDRMPVLSLGWGTLFPQAPSGALGPHWFTRLPFPTPL